MVELQNNPRPDLENRPMRYIEDSSDAERSDADEEQPDPNRILVLLHQINEQAQPYTMIWVAYDFKLKAAQLILAFVLLVAVRIHHAETKVDKLDRQWMTLTLLYMILFQISLALFMFFPRIAPRQPIVASIMIRIFAGMVVTGYYHILKGFTLYEDLNKEEKENAIKNETWLHTLRIISLWVLVLFAAYLTLSLVCLIRFLLGGIDGARLQRRQNNRRFKRVPFGSLLFAEGLDCAICMDAFSPNQKVVQLSCHETHVYHVTCLTKWIEKGNQSCPFCRVPIAQS